MGTPPLPARLQARLLDQTTLAGIGHLLVGRSLDDDELDVLGRQRDVVVPVEQV